MSFFKKALCAAVVSGLVASSPAMAAPKVAAPKVAANCPSSKHLAQLAA
jgi:hypothetical protein